MVDVTNTCFQENSNNKILPSRQIATKEIDAITLMGQAHNHMISEKKDKLKLALL